MLDIERELLADTCVMFDHVYSGALPVFNKLFIATKIPWLAGDDKGKKKNIIQRMAAVYDKHRAAKKKKEQ